MPRRQAGKLVDNEVRVAAAALALSQRWTLAGHDDPARFYVREIQTELARIDPDVTLNDSTVNRCLNELVRRSWMWAAWETEVPTNHLSSKPRLYYRLTEVGAYGIYEVLVERRRRLPLWLVEPMATLGVSIVDERLPATPFEKSAPIGRPVTRRRSVRKAAAAGQLRKSS